MLPMQRKDNNNILDEKYRETLKLFRFRNTIRQLYFMLEMDGD